MLKLVVLGAFALTLSGCNSIDNLSTRDKARLFDFGVEVVKEVKQNKDKH